MSYEHQVSDKYTVFWTDFAHHFVPQTLFSANAGDSLTASLTLNRDRWQLLAADTTSRAHARRSPHAARDAAITQADWLQEDDTDSTRHLLYPYPQLHAVRFRHVTVNEGTPAYPELFSSWMSVANRDLAPTPLDHGSFTITRATISSLGAQYMHIARLEDMSAGIFSAQLAKWTRTTPRSQVDSTRSLYAIALGANVRALDRVRWPARTRGVVTTATGKIRRLLADTQSRVPTTSTGIAAWRARWRRDADAVGRTTHILASQLQLPTVRLESGG